MTASIKPCFELSVAAFPGREDKMIDHIAELRAELAGSSLTKSEIAKARAEIASAEAARRNQRRA